MVSGDRRPIVLEQREFEARADEVKLAVNDGGSSFGRRRSNRDYITGSVFTTPRRQQRHGALVGCSGWLVNLLV